MWEIQTHILHAPETAIVKALKGAAVVHLPQTLDNADNGGLRERPLGKVFLTKILDSEYWIG